MWSNIILSKPVKGDEDGGGGSDKDKGSPSNPPSRFKHCGVLVPSNANYDLYIFGGRSGTFPLKDFWRLDLKLGRWEEIRPLPNDLSGEWPPHLQEHSMVYYQDNIYVFGGEISLSYGEDLSPLWIYSVGSNFWRRWSPSGGGHNQDEPPPYSSSQPNASSKGGWMAKRSNSQKNTIKSPELGRQGMTKTPVGRRGHSAVVWNNYMLVYGGYRDLKGSLGDLWAFHFDSESWHLFSSPELHKKNSRPWYLFSGGGLSSSSSFPCPRHSHVAVLHNNTNLYVHGGMQDLQELGDLWKFDMKSRAWSQIKTKYGPGPLHGHVGFVALESLLIMAGERGGKAVDEFWRFDFYTEIWERIVLNGCRPCPRIWPWGAMLPMVYKRVQGTPPGPGDYRGGGQQNIQGTLSSPSSSSVEENKYWWDYDESVVAHAEGEDSEEEGGTKTKKTQHGGAGASNGGANGNGGHKEEQKKRTSLGIFSEFSRFANNDYQALSESNSVCLSEEETSPCPKPGARGAAKSYQNGINNEGHQNQGSGSGHPFDAIPGLKMIEEQEGPSLIDLGEEHSHHPNDNTSGEDSPSSPQQGMDSLTFDPIVDNSTTPSSRPPLPRNNNQYEYPPTNTTRRSESALQLNLNPNKKPNSNSVKKSASVRFADMEPVSTSSSAQLMSLGRECTSDYSSMDNGLNVNGGKVVLCGGAATGFENPNYHGSGTSSLFHNNPSFKVVEAYEMGAISPDAVAGIILDPEDNHASAEKCENDSKEPPCYYYKVSAPNYLLLIGGNESHSSQVVSKRQPLSIWRLRVTRDLFSSPTSPSSAADDFPYGATNGGGSSGQRKPSAGRLTTTGF